MAKKKNKKRKNTQAVGNTLGKLPSLIKGGQVDKIVEILPQLEKNDRLRQKHCGEIATFLRATIEGEKIVHPRKLLKLYHAMVALCPDLTDVSLLVILLFRSGWKNKALDIFISLILDGREGELEPVKEKIAAHLLTISEKAEKLLPQNSVYFSQMCIVQDAFYAYEEGDTQQMKKSLNKIAYSSPYRSWKILLKGIIAFDANDDDRALGYFERCSSSPVSGIAKFYSFCMEAFQGNTALTSLPKNWSNNLAKITNMSNTTFLSLCKIRMSLNNNRVAGALKITERLVSSGISPDTNELLYYIFKHHILQKNIHKWDYWIPKLEALLGDDLRDPDHFRFCALCEERLHHWQEANKWWQAFLDKISQNNLYPDKDGKNLLYALVLRKMAHNIEKIEPEENELFFFKEPLSPENYLKKSLKYDPYDRDTHKQLLEIARIKGKQRQIKKCLEQWLKSIPDDVSALLEISYIYMAEKNLKKARACLEKTIKIDPLNRKAKERLIYCLLCDARLYAFWCKWKLARENFAKALAIEKNLGNTSTILCKWAAFEYLAGNVKRGQEIITQALAGSFSGYIYFVLTLEMERFGVPKAQSSFCLENIEKHLQSGMTAEETAKIAHLATMYALAVDENKVNELAQKLLIPYLRKVNLVKFSESELLTIARYLLKIYQYHVMEKVVRYGKQKFPGNYHFPLYLVLRKLKGSIISMKNTDYRKLKNIARQAEQASDTKTAEMVNALLTYYQMMHMMNMIGLPKKNRPSPPSLNDIIDDYLFS